MFCGTQELFSVLKQYVGLPNGYLVSSSERQVVYHNHLLSSKDRIKEFSESLLGAFELDSFSASNTILSWRDALVAAGWDMQKECSSPKLEFLRSVEPSGLPRGEADDWGYILRVAQSRRILPADAEIVVTQPAELVEATVAAIFKAQSELGTKVCYEPNDRVVAEGNLGKIQAFLLGDLGAIGSVVKPDSTFELLHFDDVDEAMRYVATQPDGRWSACYCQHPKRLDNNLRMLNLPACGSIMDSGIPQVAQLFLLGNSLFARPLNYGRIAAWLNAPISPIPYTVRHKLASALAASGGVCNDEWNEAINKGVASEEDAKEQKRLRERVEVFLNPITTTDETYQAVVAFNKELKAWAEGVVRMKESPYDDVTREQLHTLVGYCTTLISMLEGVRTDILDAVELSRWCGSIATPASYKHYIAELGGMDTLSQMGDNFSVVPSLVWLCAEDQGALKYPYDFLSTGEFDELISGGVYLYDRAQCSKMRQRGAVEMILGCRKLTIVEAGEAKGKNATKRHPIVLQLKECIGDSFDALVQNNPTIHRVERCECVDNKTLGNNIQLDSDVELKERWEMGSVESYSSLELLIKHPIDYVCNYCAKLREIESKSEENRLNLTKGNVAHLMIEKVFMETSRDKQRHLMNEAYDQLFDECVRETGLLLLNEENTFDRTELHMNMKRGLSLLWDFISDNRLEVVGCEVDLNTVEWSEAGDGVKLSSRVDMLLTDENGDMVVLDFKYSPNIKKYKGYVEENQALQLYVYKYLAEKQYAGKSVRTAYVLLPEVEIITADEFEDREAIRPKTTSIAPMQLAANSYAYRWRQFKEEHRIECGEGEVPEVVEYCQNQEKKHLYPLELYKGGVSKSYKEYSKLK